MKLDKNDIQGLLFRGHGDLPSAAYLILQIEDPDLVRPWLGKLLPRIADGAVKAPHERLQIAFSHEGLSRLGVGSETCEGYLVEFIHGMSSPYRTRILGDLDESAPENWKWGGPCNEPAHILLCVFASSDGKLDASIAQMQEEFPLSGLQLVQRLDAQSNPYGKEHFGFRDGISQPQVIGMGNTVDSPNSVLPGEFILGYPDAYKLLPNTPLLPADRDPQGLLPTAHGRNGLKDFGRNGSYMVFRQLLQDVPQFWKQIRLAAELAGPDSPAETCISLASKMVGRWPNGNPLVISPEKEGEPIPAPENNDFGFAEADAEGFKCPLGSHIRRSNPRDAMPGNKPKSSIKISNKHRILRRGRNFGPPLAPSFKPEDLLQAEADGKERGLYFICFNTNISRQFEFIQHTWCNNTKFAGLYNDPDPILGIKDKRNKAVEHEFSIQAKPLRKQVRGLTRHVHVAGGAYFFMPGIAALRFLAQSDSPIPQQQIQ